MKRFTAIALGIVALPAVAGSPDSERTIDPMQMQREAPVERFSGVARLARHAQSDLIVDFTSGESSFKPVVSYGFDVDMQGWTPEDTQYVKWSVSPVSGHPFSDIDPESKKSLFVEGPYQIYRREISAITSPSIDVPDNCRLSFWVGMTLNYSDACSLALEASGDGFATKEELWHSKDAPGEKPWAWRNITVDMSRFSGRKIQLRFVYGPGSADTFNTGGYMGDFAIDNMVFSTRAAVENIAVTTGETIRLTPVVQGGTPVRYQWLMPGAVPAISEEQSPEIYYTADGNYDITLNVTDSEGGVASKTRAAFVSVTGTAPKAAILPPATFRYDKTRLPMVAGYVPVEFKDASKGFPTSHSWAFTGVDETAGASFLSTEENPTVRYNYLHRQMVGLESANSHGKSASTMEVSVEYSGLINNQEPGDRATTFDMDDWGYFPGSNTRGITAYAEKFSKPSRPMVINGVYAFFTRADAGQLTDQIANVGVHVYSSENGLPGKKLESFWWQVTDLDGPVGGEAVGTLFPITPAVTVDDEFFIVVDGIPEYKEANGENGVTAVTLGMAAFRDHGNTAYMMKDNKWIDVSTYFPAGANHTSLMVYPSVIHSVIAPYPYTEKPLEVNAEAGKAEYGIYSIMGWKESPAVDADWLRVVNKPNGMTVDTLRIEYDALPRGIPSRKAHITLTDGASDLVVEVNQNAGTGVDHVYREVMDDIADIYSANGIRVAVASRLKDVWPSLPSGLYIIRTARDSRKIFKH